MGLIVPVEVPMATVVDLLYSLPVLALWFGPLIVVAMGLERRFLGGTPV